MWDRRRVGAVAGALGAVVFVIVFTVEGWLRPGYDSRHMFVSELALGPRGFVLMLSLFLFGALQLLFARGVAAEFPDGTSSRAGPIALALSGVGLVGAGVFEMDPIGTPLHQYTLHHWLHGVFGAPIGYGWPVTCLIFFRRFRGDARWKRLAPWTLAAGALTAVLLIPLRLRLAALVMHPELGHDATAWLGLVQRAHHGVYAAWQIAVAVRLYRLPAR